MKRALTCRLLRILFVVLSLTSAAVAQGPYITGISPAEGPVGTSVTITGSGFGATQGSSTITFNNVNAAAVSSWSDTQIVATAPKTTTGVVKVTVSGSSSNTNVYFSVPAPHVDAISPTSGAVGTQVTISGSGFGATQGSSSVNIAGSYISWSDTQIVVTVATFTKTGPVQVLNGVWSNSNVDFTVPNPVVMGVSPSSASVGTQVTISGYGFGATQGSSSVTFYGSGATTSVVSWSDTQIVVAVPAAAITGPIYLTVGGVPSNQSVYLTIPAPRVDSVSPTSGGVGTQITITGAGFGATRGSGSVNIAGSYISWSDTQIVATTSQFARTGPVEVQASNTTWSNSNVYFTTPNPLITSFSPSSGPAGTQVTINGLGFGSGQGSSTIKFGGLITASILSWSDSQIVATVPSGSVTGYIQATVGGIPNTSPSQFATGNIVVSSVSPPAGPVGTQVTVSGYGFGATQGSSILYLGGKPATNVISWNDTQIVATVPSGATGINYVYVTAGSTSNQTLVFTVTGVTIGNISPTSGPLGTQVTISGSGFGASQGSSTVTFNNNSATSLQSWSDGQIIATVPNSATTGAVRVTVAGVSSNTDQIFTVPVPHVSSISPTSGVVGTQVTISGSGFEASPSSKFVQFNGTYGTVTNWSDTQIVATVASGAVTGAVRVAVNGIMSNADNVFSMPNPIETGVSPNNGPIGTQITISGSGFGASQGASTLSVGTSNVTPLSWSDTQVTASIPSGTTQAAVKITVGGVASNPIYFTVDAPEIASISPTSGVAGTQVTITGSGFGTTQGSNFVNFYAGARASIVSWSDTQIVAAVPSTGATTGPVQVYVNSVGSNANFVFSMPAPRISGVSPGVGPVFSNVTISGSGFGASQGSSTITFDGYAAASIQSWSDTQIVAQAPSAAVTGPVKVTVGSVPSNADFDYAIPLPVISSISPNGGGVGTSVIINGSGFQPSRPASSNVIFNPGGQVTIGSWSDTQITATVPTGATTGPLKVSVNNLNSNAVTFTVPGNIISSVSPTSGTVGTQVTIIGTGFGSTQGSSSLAFGGAPTTSISSWSNTQIVAIVPDGATTGPIVATVNGYGSNSTVNFTVPAPSITSISPSSGDTGTQVTITGTNFSPTQGSSTVTFNGTLATATSWSNSSISATVPSTATTGNVVVTVSGVASNAVKFTLLPLFSSVSPNPGAVGALVTITGKNFGSSGTISFNGVSATVNSWSDTSITTTVPSGATTGNLALTIPGVPNSTLTPFTVVAAPTISSVSPSAAAVGAAVTLSGVNFGSSQGTGLLSFNGVLATPSSWTDTTISVPVPAGATSGNVVVHTGGVDSNGVSFTVNQGPPPVLQYSVDDSSISTNLTSPMNLDWAAWGRIDATTPDRRATQNSLISNYSLIGSATANTFTSNYVTFSWSDGSSAVSITDANIGVRVNGLNNGFQISVPADTTVQTLKLYVGAQYGSAQLTATLSDSSAGPITDSSINTTDQQDKTYSIDFRAASAGQTLTVTYISTGNGYVTLQAAALAQHVPTISITSPTDGQIVTAPTNISVAETATQFDAAVSDVQLFASGSKIFDFTAPPYSATWTSVAPSHYVLTGQATDQNSLSNTSKPVEVDVVGSGGSLAATLQTPATDIDLTAEGTADWVLWGNHSDVTAVDRKAGVTPAISNYKLIGNHQPYSTSGSPYNFAFDDGVGGAVGLDVNPELYLFEAGNGWELDVNADTVPRTLRLYVDSDFAQGHLKAFLSDGSATPVADDSLAETGNATGHVYQIDFQANSANQTLTVRYTMGVDYGNGHIDLAAATLSGPPMALPPPTITGTSVTSGGIGTQVTISGANFGAAQGSSTVTFNGVAATIISWSDTSITVQVPEGTPAGTTTVAVNTSGTASNGVQFSVTPPLIVTPNVLTLVVGEEQVMQILDPSGALITGASWQLDDPSVADLLYDPNPEVSAKALGQTKLRAFLGNQTGEATVNVVAARQPGDTRWSIPGDGSAVNEIIPAVPSECNSVDVFSLQASGNLLAVTSDGTIAWAANVGQPKKLLPDFQGGMVAVYPQSLSRLDCATGQVTATYSYANSQFVGASTVVHPDGTILTVDSGHIAAIDSTTGSLKFTVPMQSGTSISTTDSQSNQGPNPPESGNLIVAGDGNAYVVYQYENDQDTVVTGSSKTTHTDWHMRLLRVSSDGTSSDISLGDWSEDQSFGPGTEHLNDGDLGCQNAPNGCDIPIWVLASDIGFIPPLTWVDPITNADQGATLSWWTGDGQGGGSYWLTSVNANSVTSQTQLNLGQGATDALWQPSLQRSDGSYIGFGQVQGFWSVVAADQSGNLLWSKPLGTHFAFATPQYVLADGSVVTQQYDDQGNGPFEVTYDASGNVIPSAHGADAVFSWTGEAYRYGSIDDDFEVEPNYDETYAATTNLGPQGTYTRTGPVLKTFIPFEVATAPTVAGYIKGVQQAIPSSTATTDFYPLTKATLAEFTHQLQQRVQAIGFIGHSNLYPAANGITSIGLCFRHNGDPSITKDCTAKTGYQGQVASGINFPVVDTFQTNAKVIFIAACQPGPEFLSLWNINSTTQGEALIVPDLQQFSGEVDLGHGAAAWQTIMFMLAQGSTVQSAVAEANKTMQTQNDAERWTYIGDGNVSVAKPQSH